MNVKFALEILKQPELCDYLFELHKSYRGMYTNFYLNHNSVSEKEIGNTCGKFINHSGIHADIGMNSAADPGFPIGGHQPRRGGTNSQGIRLGMSNERIWTHRGVQCPLDLPLVFAIDEDELDVLFYSLRKINLGEQLLWNYGKNLDWISNCVKDSFQCLKQSKLRFGTWIIFSFVKGVIVRVL